MKTKSLFSSVQVMEANAFESYNPIVADSRFKMTANEAKKVTAVVREVSYNNETPQLKVCATLDCGNNKIKKAWIVVDFTVRKIVKAGMFLDPAKLVFFEREYETGNYLRVAFLEDAILDKAPVKANFKKDWEIEK